MRNISVAMTKDQIRAQKKDVTRRFGWLFLKPGDIIQPVEKGMGLKKGESIVKVGCPIRILSTRLEPLDAITQEDVVREGFPDWTPIEFINMLVQHYRVDPTKEINRIEFEYVDPLILAIGTRIRFVRTMEAGPTEESPACLYANKGEEGEVTGHGCWEGHWVKRDAWSTHFGAVYSKDFKAI